MIRSTLSWAPLWQKRTTCNCFQFEFQLKLRWNICIFDLDSYSVRFLKCSYSYWVAALVFISLASESALRVGWGLDYKYPQILITEARKGKCCAGQPGSPTLGTHLWNLCVQYSETVVSDGFKECPIYKHIFKISQLWFFSHGNISDLFCGFLCHLNWIMTKRLNCV